jgi:PHS family inorganic phosphate transporter-like MFS transporter
MLAAVFLMQPIGQFLAYIVGYAALRGITKDRLPNWTSADWDNPANHDEGAATIVSFDCL